MSDSGSESDFGPTPTKKTNRASTTKSPTKKAQHDKTLHLSKKDLDVFTNIDKPHEKGGKTSIEQQYQKKTQLEHILLRPDTYIGSVQFCEKTTMWVYDKDKDSIVTKDISYVPGLYKIFDEILVNAADNKQRDKSMNVIKIDIDQQTNSISIFNNGKGVPVVMHKVEKMYVPELIFGTLLTSSNYNDSERKVTGGRNGYGAKLCNIFSTKFTLESACKEYKKKFKQTWVKNMTKDKDAEIESFSGSDFTKITFVPDLKKFKMDKLDDDIVALMSRRAYDIAGSTRGVKVYLNGRQLPISGFKQYCELYTKNCTGPDGEPLKLVYEQVNERWEVALTVSEKNFQSVSFANSIATTKGGRHVDYIADQVSSKLIATVTKKAGAKSGIAVKPFQVKNHMWLFVNALIENPTFDSQTKETMTLQAKSFGSKAEVSEKFHAGAAKCGVVEAILSWVKFKQQEQADKKCSTKKTNKLKGIPKLDDANDAGTKNSHLCTLILTEGDSAKTLAVSGLGVVGRDKYGVFPLRGKFLNVRDANHKQIKENAEIDALLKIIGLQYRLKYDKEEDLKTLRYGKVMIMADQDQDGSHIKGLLINFFHHNWPALLKTTFLEEFITPIVKVTKDGKSTSFFSLPEYMKWRADHNNGKGFKIKYYKGLGTSTSKEAKEYFSDMAKHRIPFKYGDEQCSVSIEMAFAKAKVEKRKEWLTSWMEERKRQRLTNEQEVYLYNENTKSISYKQFIDQELILFSNMDNERSIPSLMDGLKPGQRKVLFTCFKRADKKEVKVAQLAGAVGEMSAYHHGEVSLMMTIVGLAQDFVGSNNINLLLPIGQFGTRLQGGKDSASPRYIFTQLSPLTKTIFKQEDEHVLKFLSEENQRIEPEWYCPIVPMILINGAEGIGTAWSTKIPNYNPRDVVANIRRLINNEETKVMAPWYRRFEGTMMKLDEGRYISNGRISVINDTTLEITELPIKTWTQKYKETVIDKLNDNPDKNAAFSISDYKEYHTDSTVKFVVKMSEDKLAAAEREGMHKVFQLQSIINTTSMVLFDSEGCLRRFNSPDQIMKDFFKCRKQKYIERKAFLEGMLQAQSDKLSAQAKFIMAKIKGEIKMENVKKVEIIKKLRELGYLPDPLKKWNDDEKRRREKEDKLDVVEDIEDDEAVAKDSVGDYDYLVGMALIKLSEEEKDKLIRESKEKLDELNALKKKSWSDLWLVDLDEFMTALKKHEDKEEAEIEKAIRDATAKLKKESGSAKSKRGGAAAAADFKPDPRGINIAPDIKAYKEKYEEKAKKEKKAPKKEKPVKEIKNDGDITAFVIKTPKENKKSTKNNESEDTDELSDFEDTDKRTAAKRAAAKSIPVVEIDSDSDDEGPTKKKPSPEKAASKNVPPAKKKCNMSEDEEKPNSKKVVPKKKAVEKKKTTPKKAAPKRKAIDSDEEPQSSRNVPKRAAPKKKAIDSDEEPQSSRNVPKRAAAKKSKVVISSDEENSASDFEMDSD